MGTIPLLATQRGNKISSKATNILLRFNTRFQEDSSILPMSEYANFVRTHFETFGLVQGFSQDRDSRGEA